MIVTAVREGGQAANMGVIAGDQLLSVNGLKDFTGFTAQGLHRSLRAPATIVFLGFVGKLQAEVHVRQPDRIRCGLSAETVVLDPTRHSSTDGAIVRLCDAVVFQRSVGDDSLLIAT